MLFSCAAASKHNSKTHYFQGKNEWGKMASDFRYPIELEKRIEEFLGTPYLFGGDSKDGIDCSAFVQQMYSVYGVVLPRTSILQSKLGITVPKHTLLPSDLVFFGETENDSVTHVGIYMGKNKIAHASSSRGVNYSDLSETFYSSKYLFAKRLKF
jgi:cell wall-associated NlpC family hydrolase